MKKVSRRGFLKSAAALGAGAAVYPAHLFSAPKQKQGENLQDRLFHSDYPFGYDSEYFEAAERIFFEEHNRATVNLFIKPTQSLDIRLYIANAKDSLYKKNPLLLSGLTNSVDIPLGKIHWFPELNLPALPHSDHMATALSDLGHALEIEQSM